VQNLIGGADDAGCERATEVEPQRISNCRSSSTLFKGSTMEPSETVHIGHWQPLFPLRMHRINIGGRAWTNHRMIFPLIIIASISKVYTPVRV
jgi:hypothetical protein